jgi:Na+/H+ antiporter NhaD/arsenite permease-like protein
MISSPAGGEGPCEAWRSGHRAALLATIVLLLPEPALAASLDGRALGLVWGIPFVGILLSIALLPQLAGHLWEHRMPAIAGFWIALVVIPLALFHGAGATLDAVLHVLLLEYIPFVLLLFALFTIAGGIVVAGNLHGSPAVNTGILAIGAGLASLIGTTGASMVLIRPLIRANDNRRHNAHVVVFFIFLVSNVGGALTPLGDPPLFLGFLRGISFFWTTTHLLAETLFVAAILLALFYLLDRTVFARDDAAPPLRDPTPDTRLHLRGHANFALLLILVGVIILSGVWRPGIAWEVGSARLELQNLVRDGAMVALGLVSLAITPKANRIANEFSWAPIREVATIFAAIFVCLIPVAAALGAGREGAFAPLLGLVTRADGTPIEAAYFWMTGILSSLLDNAPTYIVFFELAGGDPQRLMGPLAGTLAAISTGAVFMGANTYIGNAPNFMVYAIARQQGVRMPSFLGYMAWSGAVLIPIFVLVTLVFFR